MKLFLDYFFNIFILALIKAILALMYFNIFFINSDESTGRISPASGIIIFYIIVAFLKRLMGMSAENIIGAIFFPILHRRVSHFFGKPEPALAFSFKQTAKKIFVCIYFLNETIKLGGQITQKNVIDEKTVKLVPVDNKIFFLLILFVS